jgi:hypothetical protein
MEMILKQNIMKEESVFKPEFTYTGDKRSFADFVRKNINHHAKECGWGEVKEIGMLQPVRKDENDLIVLQVLHEDNTVTRLFMQIHENDLYQATGDTKLDKGLAEIGILDEYQDLEGFPFSAISGAFDDIINLEKDYINHDAPTRFVIVSPVIDPRLIEKAREKDWPISFLMIDNDRCAYWKASDNQQFSFETE